MLYDASEAELGVGQEVTVDAGPYSPRVVDSAGARLVEFWLHGRSPNTQTAYLIAARRAEIGAAASPHWPRHAHASHALDRDRADPPRTGHARQCIRGDD